MTQHAFYAEKNRPLVLGHRGIPLVHQENSMAAFRRCVELGIDGVELDVFKTADNRVVVFHDEDTERLTGVKGNICEMTWDQISKLRVQKHLDQGDGTMVDYPSEERIPLLEEVLEEFADKLLINIELKAYTPNWKRRHTGTEVARLIKQCAVEQRVICTSFDFFMLYYLEKEYPGLHSGFAYDDNMIAGDVQKWFRWVPEISSELAKAPGNQNDISFLNFIAEANIIGKVIGSTCVDFDYTLIDSDTVGKFHQRDMLVGAYTLYPVDSRFIQDTGTDPAILLKRLRSDGVNWIETDDPEKLMNELA